MQNNEYDLKVEQAVLAANPQVYDIQKMLRDAIAARVYDHKPDIDFSTCTYEWGEIKYFHSDPVWEPDSLYSGSYSNDSSTQDTFVFKKAESTTASFTWSITEGLKAGAKTTVEVGIPKIADGKLQVYAELNVASTQGETKSKTQSWEVNTNIGVAPHTYVEAHMVVQVGLQNASFEIDVICGGYAKTSWNGPNGRVHGEASQAAFLHNYTSIPYRSYKPPTGQDFRGEIVLTVRGTFKGVQGVDVAVVKKSRPIPPATREGVVHSEQMADELIITEG